MSKPALLNVALIAANIGSAELEFAVKKVHVLDVMKKGPTDYVTEVDRKVEEIVFEEIKKYYPEDNFLGEEEYTCGIWLPAFAAVCSQGGARQMWRPASFFRLPPLNEGTVKATP